MAEAGRGHREPWAARWQDRADIGAGTGYFAFPLAKKAAKVIAIDIDQRFLDYIERRKHAEKTSNIETRLTAPNASGLKAGEADVVLIVDTFITSKIGSNI